MAIPYKTLKPFTFNGVQFKTGDLFLPEVVGISQYKLTQMVSNRHLSIVTDATEQDVTVAKKHIEAAIRKLAQPIKEEKEAPVEATVEKKEETPSYEEDERPQAENPVSEQSNTTPATSVPEQEEEAVAEEGEESKPATVKRRRRS